MIRPGAEGHKLPLDRLLAEAADLGASRIHIEPDPAGGQVRMKASLQMFPARSLRREEYTTLWQNIMDRFGVERLEPFFEGSFAFTHGPSQRIVRVSIIPTPFGDAVTLKISAHPEGIRDVTGLGLRETDLERYWGTLARARGLILVTGHPGSGASTTFVSTLAALADGRTKIITIEDPIDIHLPGVQQIQVKVVAHHPERSVTFAKALRAASLQAPDVIAIGLVRDAEAATQAIQAALAGSLVLARLHAASAAQAIVRLASLSVPPALIADCLRAVLSQVLVRRNCPHCRRPVEREDVSRRHPWIDLAPLAGATLAAGAGCGVCQRTGLAGAVALFELLPAGGEIARRIAQGAATSDLTDLAIREGMIPVARQLCELVASGEAPFEEYVRWL